MSDNPQQPWQGDPHPPPSGNPPQYGGPGQDSAQGGYAQAPPPPPGQPVAAGDERTWMLAAHLSAPIAAIISAGWLSIVGPLIVWLLQKGSRTVRPVAAGAFNFNLAFWLMNLIAWICLFTVILIPVAVVIWVIIWPVALFCHIRGVILASRGEVYRYPFQLPVLR